VVTFHGIASADPAMHLVFETCRNVAETESSVLIRGESGVGKELLARAIHTESARAGGPFVALNCAALPASLAESELFGHVEGAFTGAVRDREGLFRQAHGGTLFLDELAELPLELQAKLLRVLEDRRVTPVGGSRAVPVDVRIVAATHQSLRQRVAAGLFREDLMFRLRVVPIFVPPLRERRADVSILLWRFIGERNLVGPRVIDSVAPEAMRALLDHRWPGNVRELRNVVEYAFAVGRGPELRLDDLPPELRDTRDPTPAPARRDGDEAAAIRAALAAAGGNVGRAAAALGTSRPTLWRKRKKYGI
jgi:transcriptional regulator with PAS, ATPase and Fis domain